MIESVSFVGSGHVATHLAMALSKSIRVQQIFSRKLVNASNLSEAVNASPITSLDDLQDVDLLLICIPDDAIHDLILSISDFKGIVAHTSGIKGIELPHNRAGFFYPLQSFRKQQSFEFSTCPLFINAKIEEDRKMMIELASSISTNVKSISIEEKRKLHLAAVFLNNYVNQLFGLTHEYLTKNNLSFSDLAPIIETTVQRAFDQNPYDIQTGPAIRDDKSTIKQHLMMLSSFPEMKKVYQCLAESIQNIHHD